MRKEIKKVVLGISGGVDSSVAALLLKRAGFDVYGIFMRFWKEGHFSENSCCSLEAEKRARKICQKLGIKFKIIDCRQEFKKKVVDDFINKYEKGNTPNPCVICNRKIKFEILAREARKIRADFIATGHYASIEKGAINQAKDKTKDQSYFLWNLDAKTQLPKLIFPLADFSKLKIREIARKNQLPVSEIKDSQEICFVEGKIEDFLARQIKQKKGKIKDLSGKILGEHKGLVFYTIGQRKGLFVSNGPYFVVSKNSVKNELAVSKLEKDLFSKKFQARSANWISNAPKKFRCAVKIRNRHTSAMAKIKIGPKKTVFVEFLKPQKAITPGQSAVFYQGKKVLGGAIIAKSFPR